MYITDYITSMTVLDSSSEGSDFNFKFKDT